ncbi:MAG TPA: cytochrome c-type biogenesis protein CcmH [Solirubrobacterales bacterium]|nr:cytochrome c-type biogenesis protein CcmH [Solirubrobacterales bacterium]
MSPRAARALALAGATLALMAVSLAPAAAAGAATPQTSLSEISGEVMCPVCGTLLELAESPQAQREKAFIQRLVDEGRSKQEIKDALVAEYGDEVLALPQDSGFSLSAYVVPIVAFIVAAIAIAFGVAKWRRASGSGDDSRPAAAGLSAEDSARLDEDLGRYDL